MSDTDNFGLTAAHKFVYKTLKSVMPGCYLSWNNTKPPKPPWFIMRTDADKTLLADNSRYFPLFVYTVDIYATEPTRDLELIEKLANTIQDTFGPYKTSETYLASERCYVYTFIFNYYQRS